MAFDLGFNFRRTLAFVTDGPEGTAVLLDESYPTTYTNGNGYSVNAGWDGSINFSNFSASDDPRIAGSNHLAHTGVIRTFLVDLSSGSAPGAGTYNVDIAVGMSADQKTSRVEVRDDATVVIDMTNGGAGLFNDYGHYWDATITDRTASTTWNGVAVSKAFATVTASVVLNPAAINDAGATASTLAHFRLTLEVPPAGPTIDLGGVSLNPVTPGYW